MLPRDGSARPLRNGAPHRDCRRIELVDKKTEEDTKEEDEKGVNMREIRSAAAAACTEKDGTPPPDTIAGIDIHAAQTARKNAHSAADDVWGGEEDSEERNADSPPRSTEAEVGDTHTDSSCVGATTKRSPHSSWPRACRSRLLPSLLLPCGNPSLHIWVSTHDTDAHR